MSDNHDFFKLRREGKAYISKVFTFPNNTEPMRNVVMVLEGSDILHLGEIEGALRLRMSGVKRKTQVTALVSQDDKAIRRVTLQTFQSRNDGDWYQSFDEHSFTLRRDEYHRLMSFLDDVNFIDLSNADGFHIEDMSGGARRRAIVDAADRSLIEQVCSMNSADKATLLSALGKTLTSEEINVLLGRRAALEEFEREMQGGSWSEPMWQAFFERQPWVFGYGLHYLPERRYGTPYSFAYRASRLRGSSASSPDDWLTTSLRYANQFAPRTSDGLALIQTNQNELISRSDDLQNSFF